MVNGGFLLVNPNNTGEDIPPPSPVRMKQADSKERLFFKSKSSSSTRTKSPSFFKMLVGRGLRKVSNNETEDSDKKGGDTGFFSDNDEPVSHHDSGHIKYQYIIIRLNHHRVVYRHMNALNT